MTTRIVNIERFGEVVCKATVNSVSRSRRWIIDDKPDGNGSLYHVEVNAVVNGSGEKNVHLSHNCYLSAKGAAVLSEALKEAVAWLADAAPAPKEFE